MFVKLCAGLMLLATVRGSEAGHHPKKQHRSQGTKSLASTRADDFMECEVENRLTYVHPGEQITVVSPHWPENYGRWEHCGWRFWTMMDASLTFFCDQVELSNGDPLQVYQDLKEGETKDVYSLENGTLHFPTGYVNVEFSSSFFNGNAGFKCHIESKTKATPVPATTTVESVETENSVPETEAPASPGEGSVIQCSGVQTGIFVESGSSVTLVSPGYPDMYPVKTKCGWDLKTSPGQGLVVSCDSFSLNNKDYLILAHGRRANKHRYEFDQAPQNRKFAKGRLMVRFTSSIYTPGAGFSCTVTAYGL